MLLAEGFQPHQIKSLQATAKLVSGNGARFFISLEEVAEWLNSQQLVTQIEQPEKVSYLKQVFKKLN